MCPGRTTVRPHGGLRVFAIWGYLPTWDGLVRPVLKRAGDQWENKQVGIDVEHVLSDAVTAGLAVDTPVKREGCCCPRPARGPCAPLGALRGTGRAGGIGASC